MIRTKEWKYVERYPRGPNELYDLVYDPEERANLYDDPLKKEIVVDLRDCMEEWFAEYVNPVLDGRKQPVKGKGQINLVRRTHAKESFNPLEFRQTQKG